VDITATEFYTRQADATTLSTTSQVTVNQYKEAYQMLLDQGHEVLVLPISVGISGSYYSALQALSDFPGKPIELIDTKLVSMALSFMVLTAARAAEKGADLVSCKYAVLEAYPRIGVYFTVETLKYLAAGGRVASVRTKKKAVLKMLDLIEKDIAGRQPVRISVFHANVPEEAQELMELATTRFNAVESILSEVSPAIGSHTGPGTISVAYMAG
jgi:fatty acid-binding protein DegV